MCGVHSKLCYRDPQSKPSSLAVSISTSGPQSDLGQVYAAYWLLPVSQALSHQATIARQKYVTNLNIITGKTYFFKNKGYWKFNDLKMRVEHEKQYPSATYWMGCPADRTGRRAPFRALPAPGSTLRSPSAAGNFKPNFMFATFLSLLTILCIT